MFTFVMFAINVHRFTQGCIFSPDTHSPFEKGDSSYKMDEWKDEYGESPIER